MARRVTRASLALSARCSQRHGAQRDVARAASIPQPRLSRLASGRLFPRADEAVRLARAADVPVEWWDEPADAEEEDAA